jgi:predicted metal-binding membrane protein
MTQLALTPRLESRLLPAAVLAGVLTATAAAWLVLIGRMAGMDTGPGGDPGAVGWFAATWAVMTVAMMLPAAAPAVLGLASARPARVPPAAALFVLGYVAVWMLAGLIGYVFVQAVRGLGLGALGWSAAGRYVAGAAIVAAGLYQLTDVKRRWLARCTAPDLHRGRESLTGSVRAGAEHGGCCVACCWTLMAALYALGIMSLVWMAVLTVLIAGERLLPRPDRAVWVVAAALVGIGLAVAFAPGSVPALTIPHAGHAMMMGMPRSVHAMG